MIKTFYLFNSFIWCFHCRIFYEFISLKLSYGSHDCRLVFKDYVDFKENMIYLN